MLPLLLLMGAGAAFLLTRKSEEEAPPSPALLPAPAPELPPLPESMALPPLPKAILTRLPPLDAGLSGEEVVAIRSAVTHETDPGNLTSFASTFEPMFPIAGSVLRFKANQLQTGVSGEPCCDDCADGMKPPCTPIVTGPPIFAGLPKSLVPTRS